MNHTGKNQTYKIRNTHFPVTMFLITFLILLLMGGLHTGLVLAVNVMCKNGTVQTSIIIAYWGLVSVAFTMFTRWQMKRAYEVPMQKMAEAAGRVAGGDFSVYIPPIHTSEKLDYLDVMIMDFNKMVEELGSIETLKTDFFSNVSHEIKTPIAVIMSAAENLNRTMRPDSNQQEFVNMIILASKKLSSLITNILKLNKLEKQNIRPVIEAYDLSEQLCSCILQFEHTISEKEIDFEADLEDKLIVTGDESLLELVWTNLLSNAFKFTPKGGIVRVTETCLEEEVVVTVSDNGCGMSRESKEHIFDKFYQGDTSHSTSGNGLGLAIAARIIQLLGGTIQVQSELDKGSTFTVRLPAGPEKYWQP